MSLWERLFGRPKWAQVLDVLREDRAANSAILTELLGAVKAQQDLAKAQFDALAFAGGEPTTVHLRTPAEEAHFEHLRALTRVREGKTQSPDEFLRSFSSDPSFFGDLPH